jgi:dihydropteroate synthase
MFTLNCQGKLQVIKKPMIMGIINATTDSFYEGSRFTEKESQLRQAEKMISEGADILDIGGQSTRPGSTRVGAGAELDRVGSAIESIHAHFPEVLISVDTYYAKVAEESLLRGASMVNDISAGSLDEEMLPLVARFRVPYLCMHMKGTPLTMQQDAVYENVVKDLLDFFVLKVAECRNAGITDIFIDPGFGFGKTREHNFELLKNLSVFKILDCPIAIGISRKSSIYKTLGSSAALALNGTTVLNTIGLLNGADLLRVHDVREAREAVTLVTELYGEGHKAVLQSPGSN